MANFNLKNYNEVTTLKKTKTRALFGISLTLCFLIFTFLFSLILTPLLGLNYLNAIFSQGSTTSSTFYAVMINTDSTDSDYATEQAQNYRVRGGAGVLLEKETYFIVLSAYPNKSDAESVSEQITTENIIPEIMEITFQSTNTSSFSAEEKELYNNCFNFAIDTLNSLYDISYKLDTGTITELTANLNIKNLLLDTTSYNQQLFANQTDNLKKIRTIISSVSSLLEYVADEEVLTSTTLPYAGDIRRVLVRILLVIYELE